MNPLTRNWQQRSLIIVLITIVLGACMVPLASTEWAEGFRVSAQEVVTEGEKRPPFSPILVYAISALKILVLMGVPLLLTLGIQKLYRHFKPARQA